MRKNVSLSLLLMTAIAMIMVVGCSDDNNNATNPFTNPTGTAKVRVIHTSYDAPPVDIAVDGAVAISDLEYGATSGYAELAAGSRNIMVTPAGETTPVVIDVTLPLEANQEYSSVSATRSDPDGNVLSILADAYIRLRKLALFGPRDSRIDLVPV